MIVRDNIFLMGVSGKVKNMVVKQYKDKTVITSVPDMKNRVLSKKQEDANTLMRFAIAYAKKIVASSRLKEKACQELKVPPNKVFRAIVKHFLLTDGKVEPLEESSADTQTLTTIKSVILSAIPDAQIMLYGSRAVGNYTAESDWDLLILTMNEYPKTVKWELQDKLFAVTISSGARVNLLLVQKTEWDTNDDYRLIREKIGEVLLAVL